MWGGPFFVGAGGDENLKINFLWPYDLFITTDSPTPKVIQTRLYTFFSFPLGRENGKRQEDIRLFSKLFLI